MKYLVKIGLILNENTQMSELIRRFVRKTRQHKMVFGYCCDAMEVTVWK